MKQKPDGTEKTYAYDAASRLIHMANKATDERREYDARGLLLTTSPSFDFLLSQKHIPLQRQKRAKHQL